MSNELITDEYVKLSGNDIIKDGDEWFGYKYDDVVEKWHTTEFIGQIVKEMCHPYRRKKQKPFIIDEEGNIV